MIDVMDIKCPHYFDASLVRRTKQHVSWNEISREIQGGYGNTILSVGDTISFQLKNGKAASVSVAAINPYSPNSVVFAFDDLLWEAGMNDSHGLLWEAEMNNFHTNRGGWANSKMARFLESDVLPLLPSELTSVIAPRKIVQILDGVQYERTSKLWLPSRTEIAGEEEDKAYKECDLGDVQFPLFKTQKSRVKSFEDGDTGNWWLRSPSVNSSSNFWYVSNFGLVGGDGGASYILGVCPCFIIGAPGIRTAPHRRTRKRAMVFRSQKYFASNAGR